MGLFTSLFQKRDDSKEEQTSNAQETTSAADVLLQTLLKSETINKNKALSIPAVSSAVDRISNLVAMLPVKLYKKEKDGDNKYKVVEVLNDPRTKLLNQDTKDTLDTFQLKKAIARDYLMEKGAYVFIEKNLNKFKSIRYVEPDNIQILKNYDPIFRDIKYEINGQEYETYNFLTILRNTTDGATGKSIVNEISKSLETSFTTIMYELGLVKKGGGKKGFLSSKRRIGEEEMKKLKKAWDSYYGKEGIEENVVILNDGLEFKEGASSTVELQMNERKKTLKEDINDVFHISSKYDETIKDAVMPIISAIESALNRNFLLESEKEVFYFAFDTKKITRGSLKERYEAYKIASDTGWLGTNEIRSEEDYDAIDGFDVIKLNLGNVLYDTKSKTFYTPNTGEVLDVQKKKLGGDTDENRS
jgi:HK97 family phage portal protein